MSNSTYFWFPQTHASLVVSPLTTADNFPILNEKIIGVKQIIPVDKDAKLVRSLYNKTKLQDTPCRKAQKETYGQFLRTYSRVVGEYILLLENNMIVYNIGSIVMIDNCNATYINSCLSMMMGKAINVEALQPERFYKIKRGVVVPTEHLAKDAMSYIAGLFIPEIFD